MDKRGKKLAPRLYLIESEEREGLVKIGFTGNDVENRIQSYRTGISDPSLVYEMSGSRIFEAYLHRFFNNYRKSVPIRFRLLDKLFSGPREWFELDTQVLAMLTETFEKEQPKTVEEVDIDKLPAFLSGLASAIQWEAEISSPERLAEMARWVEIMNKIGSFEKQVLGKEGIGQSPTVQAAEISLDERDNQIVGYSEGISLSHHVSEMLVASPDLELAQSFAESRGEIELRQREIAQFTELRDSRTALAVAAIVFVVCLWIAGVSANSIAVFSCAAFILVAIWPKYYYPLAKQAVVFWHWVQNISERSRNDAGADNE